MDMETYSGKQKLLKLREELLEVEEYRAAGGKGYTIDELDDILSEVIDGQ